MSTDRELLEVAAKAAGVALWTHEDGGLYIADPMRRWNPLTDDGDALRLAGLLRLRISISDEHMHTEVVYYREFGFKRDYGCLIEPWAEDRNAATRRAIVRAAAQIGKTNQPGEAG